jgi:hypothetical protein
MSSLHDNPFLLASGSPTDPTFPVQRSVRLRSSASAYFNRTPASAGSLTTWTWSAWVKPSQTTTGTPTLFGVDIAPSSQNFHYFTFSNAALDYIYYTTSVIARRTTTQVFRDPSAWYHLVFVWDTTNATASNRMRIYVNGVQVTAFSATTDPSLNLTGIINSANLHSTGSLNYDGTQTQFYDGYLTEINFIDGQALTPSSFGGYNTGTGVWEPRKYSGTYGTNGFYLNFQDNSGATATTIGKDSSGNGNNWTPNNISVTAGVTYDSMVDVPTLTSATNANFCTLNPLQAGNAPSNGNLSATTSGTAHRNTLGTIFFPSGKYYYEVSVPSIQRVSAGMATSALTLTAVVAGQTAFLGFYGDSTGSTVYNGASSLFTQSAVAANDVYQFCVDASTGNAWFGRNNTFYSSAGAATGNPATGVNPTWTGVTLTNYAPEAGVYDAGTTANINFGQRPFSYTPPTGFKSLNTYNLPDPTIPSGDDFHKVYTYTGNGGGLQVGEIQKPASLFNLDRSLRFRSSASAYLSRTIGTPTNSVKCTFSGWVKRGALGTTQIVFGGFTGTDADTQLYFSTTNKLTFVSRITNVNGAAFEWAAESARVFNDPFQWLHIVVKVDTSTAQATNNDYYTVYVDGIAQTFTTVSGASLVSAAIVQNRNTCWNVSGYTARLGTQRTTNYFDGYLADVYFIDGQALTPTDFGTYDGNFYWTPKAYTGTYGTNGFHLEFEDNSAATAAAIGKDTSGNVNNWTPSGISVTAGVTYDSMTDVPTLTSSTTANYCVINPLGIGVPAFKNATSLTISNGNLTYSKPSATGYFGALGTFAIPPTGKWYWEFTPTTNVITCGISVSADYASSGEFGVRVDNATILVNGSSVQTGLAGLAVNDVIGCAWNADSNSFQFYKNGSTYGTAVPFTPAPNAFYYPYLMNQGTGISVVANANFGQRPFSYTPPTGFKDLNSFNIAEVTDDLESPDFVWIKSRSAATSHALFNSVTGVNKYLSSNATTAETTDVNSLIQFNKNGFLLGNAAIVNTSAATYVASAWKAGGAAVTNTAGSITSQVSANQKAGFSVVTYTGTGANATVGHGLGVAPRMMIIKARNVASDWVVYHASIGNTGAVFLSLTNATSTSSLYFQNTSPTSNVFSLGIAGGVNNSSSNTYVAYCFSEIAGFSKFGSYTGNGSTDGTFVFLGFRPRWLMIKCTSSAGTDWFIEDISRNTYNPSGLTLQANTATVEANNTPTLDILSNGFKLRSTYSSYNTNGGTYIYAAFAENPTKYSLAR